MIEVRGRTGPWRQFSSRPDVGELEAIEVRGHSPRANVRFGDVLVPLDFPIGRLRLSDIPDLQCHIGLLPVAIDGNNVGELNVRPEKLTTERWEQLRRDLDAVWTGLVLDDPAPTALEATGPDPVALWHRLGPVIAQFVDQPITTLGTQERWLRRERVRTASDLTVSVALAHHRGQPGRARVVAPVVAEAERALVRDCLLRLQAYARRHPRGRSVSSGVGRFLSSPLLAQPAKSTVSVTHLARHDSRLRQVVAVRQILLNTSSLITEGPGDLRLGVKSIDKLYEYWVFLQVLVALRSEFGEPLGSGFESLAVRLSGGRLRLELPAGTSVEFAGGIHAVFEPRITQSGRNSWRQLELSPAPPALGRDTPMSVEPDIVVFNNERNEVVVIDAKYRSRHVVDQALSEVYAKYSRFRNSGIGIVTEVIVAHPHDDFRLRWAGQRAIPLVPGVALTDRLWPSTWATSTADVMPDPLEEPALAERLTEVDLAPVEAPSTATEPLRTPTLEQMAPTVAPRPIPSYSIPLHPPQRERIPLSEIGLVICDQQWTASEVGPRRLDLLTLRQLSSNGKPSYMIGADHGSLQKFQSAAHHKGWNVVVANARGEFLQEVENIVRNSKARAVAVISGYDDVVDLVRALGRKVDVIDELDEYR